MTKSLLLVSGLLLPFMFASGQDSGNDTLQLGRDKRGKISIIQFGSENAKSRPMSNDKAILSQTLNLRTGDDDLKLVSSTRDGRGKFHNVYAIWHKGVRVEHSQYITHGNETLEAMNGLVESFDPAFSVTPSLDSSGALAKAMTYFKAEKYAWDDSASLMAYKKIRPDLSFAPRAELLITRTVVGGRDTVALAWKVSLIALNPFKEGDVYISAKDGSILKFLSSACNIATPSQFKHKESTIGLTLDNTVASDRKSSFDGLAFRANTPGTAETRYSGTQTIVTDSYSGAYRLAEVKYSVLPIQTLDLHLMATPVAVTYITDNDNNWTATEMGPYRGVLDAHYNTENVAEFYKTKFNWNGVDNTGTAMNTLVNWGTKDDPATTNSQANAAYSPGLDAILIGPGGVNGFVFMTYLSTLDAIAHEYRHKNLWKRKGLLYEGETGALNEFLADSRGVEVEAWKMPGNNIWMIGEQCASPNIRNLANPKLSGIGPQPDTKGGTYWYNVTGCSADETNDQCGVHTNSGVLNRWRYLFAQGGTGTNDAGSVYKVNGVGLALTDRIIENTVEHYLTSGSKFDDWRNGVILAIRDSFGLNSCTEIAATSAFYAVGIGTYYQAPPASVSVPGICTTGSFSVANVPTGGVVTWSFTSGLFTSNTGSGNPYTATRSGTVTGTGTASVKITLSGCSDTIKNTVTFRVGVSEAVNELFKTPNVGSACGWDIYSYLPVGATDLQLSTNGGSTWTTLSKTWNAGLGKYQCLVETNNDAVGTVSYLLRAVNACGNTANATKSISLTKRSSGCAARVANSSTESDSALVQKDNTTSNDSLETPSSEGPRFGKDGLVSSSLMLYPNPNDGKFTVRISGKNKLALKSSITIKRIQIYNAQGHLIYDKPYQGQGEQQTTLSLGKREPGTYIISVSDGTNVLNSKFIIH